MPSTPFTLPLSVALRSRSVPSRPLDALLASVPEAVVVARLASGGIVAGGLTPEAAAGLLGQALRGDDIMAGVLLDRGAQQISLNAKRSLDRARRHPQRIDVDATPADPRRDPLQAALDLTAAIMRRRTPAMWEVLDALDACDGNAERVARARGTTGQAIRACRRRAHASATAGLAGLIAALIVEQPPPSN